MVKLAIIASSYGIPVADLLEGLRNKLNIRCVACKAATEVLRKLNNLGPKMTEKLIKEIINR